MSPVLFLRVVHRYEGEWAAGLRHGRGQLHFSTGDKLDADWVQGRLADGGGGGGGAGRGTSFVFGADSPWGQPEY